MSITANELRVLLRTKGKEKHLIISPPALSLVPTDGQMVGAFEPDQELLRLSILFGIRSGFKTLIGSLHTLFDFHE